MKKPSVLLLGLIVITACRSVEDKEAAAWEQSYKAEQARAQTEIQQLKEGDRQAKAHFLERYGRYKCSWDDVPQTDESKGPGHRFKSMHLGDHLALKLKLGKATHADGHPYGPTRTASRYQLFWDGKLVGEAESLFSTGNEGSSVNRIFYCPKDHTVVVFDDLCWSTKRFFVFEKSTGSDTTPAWRTKYFEVPDPPTTQPLPDLAPIWGVGNGHIYMEIDGDWYAFPFDDFLVTKLEFTVGWTDVQQFASALAGNKVTKGIFLTTSTFTKEAVEFAKKVSNSKIVDGDELAELMIDHNVGVSVAQVYEVKRIDSDYFAEGEWFHDPEGIIEGSQGSNDPWMTCDHPTLSQGRMPEAC